MLRTVLPQRWCRRIVAAVAVAGVLMMGDALWLVGKAEVAQVLLSRAWSATLVDGERHKPWSWADHWPVARLEVPEMMVDQIVLAGDSGAVLAFAPGHNMRSGRVGHDEGNVVISGHRDTHFRFLQNVTKGMLIRIATRGKEVSYRVREMAVVDATSTKLPLGGDVEQLVLVTCYPFDSLSVGGPLRYVVWAEKVQFPG